MKSRHLKLRLASALLTAGTVAMPVHALAGGGGDALSRMAGDLTVMLNKAAKMDTPPKTLDLKLDYKPPEYVPGGSTKWSTGKIEGAAPKFDERLTDKFNRATQ